MSLLVHRPLPLRPHLSTRAFSTTLARPGSLHIEKNDPELVADTVPVYPYGPAQWYKQSNKGLYGASRVQFGNNIGPKFNTKTRRTWHPNIHRKRLWSHALQRTVQIKVQARVLRTIDKVGGLDNYLLGDKAGRVKELGETGWWLRWAIMQTPIIRSRFAKERQRLGLPKEGIESMMLEAETTPEREALAATEGQSVTGPLITRRSATFRQARLLKFRVDRGRHFVFTSEGWRRAQPEPRVRRRRAVLMRRPELRNLVDTNLKKLNSQPSEDVPLTPSADMEASSEDGTPLRLESAGNIMQQVLSDTGVELTPKEEKAVRKAVARELRAEQERLVTRVVEGTLRDQKERPIRIKAEKARKQEMWLNRNKKKEEQPSQS